MKTGLAYITLLSSQEYLKGVLVLAKSLQKVKSKFPLVILMPSDFIRDHERILSILSENRLDWLELPGNFTIPEKNSRYMHSRRWVNTYDKLQVFGLTKFTKLVFLDSDMLVVKNIDDLFDKPHLTFAAASEQVSGHESWDMPNTGMMVIEPEPGLGEKIFKNWWEVQSDKTDFSDQDLVHYYYRHKFKNSATWRVPATYNAFVFLLDKIIDEKGYNLQVGSPDEKTISVLHFAMKDRPWMMSFYDKYLFYLQKLSRRKFKEISAYQLYFNTLSSIKIK